MLRKLEFGILENQSRFQFLERRSDGSELWCWLVFETYYDVIDNGIEESNQGVGSRTMDGIKTRG